MQSFPVSTLWHFGVNILCIVGCLAVPWPLLARCLWACASSPFPQLWHHQNVSRRCLLPPVLQGQWLRTITTEFTVNKFTMILALYIWVVYLIIHIYRSFPFHVFLAQLQVQELGCFISSTVDEGSETHRLSCFAIKQRESDSRSNSNDDICCY